MQRFYDGFTNLIGGVDGGDDPTLIGTDQCATAINVDFDNSIPHTRAPWVNLPYTFLNSQDQANWTGIFQGSRHYDNETGPSGWVVARGGRLFFIDDQQFILHEITPQDQITAVQGTGTAAGVAFLVPAINGNVNINISNNAPVSVGQSVFIFGGQYLIQNIVTNQLITQYLGGDLSGGTVPAGTLLNDQNGNPITQYQTFLATLDFVYMFQAENYMIVLLNQYNPIIYDGSTARVSGGAATSEIPPGFIGAYGWGRIWICLPNRHQFIAGDIVYGPSGTAQNGFRDAILKFTENQLIDGGGAFSTPINAGFITGMQFLATQDTSLGVGVLLVSTTNMVFSVNAPVDRTTWQNLTYPIQTVSLIDYGPLSPNSAVSINGDMWYRSIDGFRSFVVARRLMDTWGNTASSFELDNILQGDDDDLLFYGSGAYFDNRYMVTVSPFIHALGVAHRGCVVMNFDTISNLREKTEPIWEGVRTGLNILQMDKATVRNVERGFMFVAGADIELWEIIMDEGDADSPYDTFNTLRTPIQSVLVTRMGDHGTDSLKKLYIGELYLDRITDNVTMTVKFRPDQFPQWITWATIQLCIDVTQCTLAGTINGICQVFQMNSKGYAARLLLPRAPETCNPINIDPTSVTNNPSIIAAGYYHQFRIEWTGSIRIRKFKTTCVDVSEPTEGACPPVQKCIVFPICPSPIFGTYDSHQGGA